MKAKPEYAKHDIQLEHLCHRPSTGLAEIVARRGAIAPYIDGVWACEFIESPLQPGFLKQKEFAIDAAAEIAQIGIMIDNTTKTRAIFEINKGTNKNAAIDVNAKVLPEDRRIPLQNMIYIADGPSDVPSFSVVKKGGGKTYAVYNPAVRAEFEQNDRLRHTGRIDHYGPADYTEGSCHHAHWLQLQIEKLCDRVVGIAKPRSPRASPNRPGTSARRPTWKSPNHPNKRHFSNKAGDDRHRPAPAKCRPAGRHSHFNCLLNGSIREEPERQASASRSSSAQTAGFSGSGSTR